ncbi:MAG: TRAP transporter large permease [Phycisphaerae bacterium]
MSDIELGILGCVVLLVLLMSSMPVAFVMAIIGMVGMAILRNPELGINIVSRELYTTLTGQTLSVIPLFVLMGQVAFHSGISRKLFKAAYSWIGWLPGGMAMATVGACSGFGAICGSGPATSATIGAVALPEMKRYGYRMQLATGAVAAGGSLGMLIPPSVVFIVYAVLTQGSIGDLFIAGLIPGTLITLIFCITIFLWCKLRPSLGPAGEPTSLKEKIISLGGVFETLILFLLVIGGIFLGWFAPIEAAAIGAFGSLVIAAAKRKLTLRMLKQALKETARTTCMVMIIVAGAKIFGQFLARTELTEHLATWLATVPAPAWLLVTLILAFYFVAGCFVDALALVLLTVPIFHPVVVGLGYDSIWFGVMIVVVTQMGVISPPVGVNVYVVAGIERDVSLQTVFRGALPFLLALVVAAAVLIIFPDLTTFLPKLIER